MTGCIIGNSQVVPPLCGQMCSVSEFRVRAKFLIEGANEMADVRLIGCP
jgi:hypothetical protein